MSRLFTFAAATALAALALAAQGCATPKTPLAISRGTYSEVQNTDQQALPQEIKMLSLEKAQEISLKNNPSFRQKFYAIEQARAQYYKAFSGYMPTVAFKYSIGQGHDWSLNADAGNYNTQKFYSTPALTATMTVFDSLQREMNLVAAKHSWQATAAAEQDARRLLLRSVSTAYNQVLLAHSQIRIAKANMKFNYDLLKETELKFEAGASPLSDVLNFKVNYNTAESTLYTAEYTAIAAKFALAQLLGLTEGTIPDQVQFPDMPSADGEMLANINFYLDTALQNRPDLKQYREAYEASKYSYYSSIGAFGPTVTFNMSMDVTDASNHYRGKAGNKSYSESPRGWGIDYGMVVSWELFTGGRKYFTMKAAEAAMDAADFQVASTWITVITDVRTAYENYQTNLKKVKLYQKNLELVRKQRDLVNREYVVGSTGITRLNEAQTELVNAENSLADAVINMHNAKAQLQAATNSL